MWCQVLLLTLIFPYLSVGLEQNALKFSIQYFKYRDVKFVCLLTCENDISWSLQFSKLSLKLMMAVSATSIDDSLTNYNRVENCLQRKLVPVGVIIDAGCGKSEDVLYFASENRWLDANHKWLLIDDEEARTESYNDTDTNVIMFDKDRNATLVEVLDNLNISVDADLVVAKRDPSRITDAPKLLDEWFHLFAPVNYNRGRRHRLFAVPCSRTVARDQSPVPRTLSALNALLDAKPDVFTDGWKKIDNSNYKLYDVYNYGKIQGGSLIVREVGSWGADSGLQLDINLNGYKYYRRWDFQNITMRMILVVQPAPKQFDPESLTGPEPVPGVAMITQASAAVLYVVAKMHNIRYTPTITDRWIGTYERNSSRVVSNTLYFREQDLSPIIRRLKSVQENNDILNTPLTAIETRYYYRIPTQGPGKFENQFLRPLSPTSWWSMIAVSATCAALLLLSALLEQRPSSVQYAVFSVVASVCQQFFQDIDDGGSKRISTARKVTILVTGLFCVLVYNYYTSSVVSWLLNGPPPSINSLKELLESPLELIYEDIGYSRSWLQTPVYYFNKRNAQIEDELRKKKVFNKKKDAPLLVDLVEGIQMVQRGGYAYHTEVNSANALISKTFTQDELCELGSLQSMEKTVLYPVLQKHSPFKEFMTWSLMRLSEQGIVSCIQIRRSSFEVKCEGSSPRALALGGAAPAFILLAGGYILATVIMMVERMIYKMKHSHDIP